jgi:glycosyltransferase involved in cell wall biosynthesis
MVKKLVYIKVFISIIFFFFDFKIILNIYLFISYLKDKIRFKKIEIYSKKCEIIRILKNNRDITQPKISIISPVYNREKFILRFIWSIQQQTFNDVEIIFVDDNSSDKSIYLIKKYMKNDKRIKLIKNRKNRGTFKARNIGALYSKGKYVIIPDPDDILCNNILRICYKYAEKYKYDFIRFNIYLGNGKLLLKNLIKNLEGAIVYQPELSTYIFYGTGKIKEIDFYITNKFIRKKIYIKALNSLNNFYSNIYMIHMEDQIMNILIYRISKIYYYINIIGYRYIKSKESITSKLILFTELELKFIFFYLKFIYEFSKNTKFEKDMANHLFSSFYNGSDIKNKISLLVFNKDKLYFYDSIINMYLNCTFIDNDNKLLLKKLKNIINKANQTYIESLAKKN